MNKLWQQVKTQPDQLFNSTRRFYGIVRYLIVGVSSVILDFSLYWIIVNVFSVWYILAQVITGPIVIGYNYLGHHRFTFKKTRSNTPEILRFLSLVTFNYFLGILLLYFYTELFGLGPMYGKVAAVATFTIYNYLALDKFVFRTPKNK